MELFPFASFTCKSIFFYPNQWVCQTCKSKRLGHWKFSLQKDLRIFPRIPDGCLSVCIGGWFVQEELFIHRDLYRKTQVGKLKKKGSPWKGKTKIDPKPPLVAGLDSTTGDRFIGPKKKTDGNGFCPREFRKRWHVVCKTWWYRLERVVFFNKKNVKLRRGDKLSPIIMAHFRWSPYSRTAPLSWSWDLTNVTFSPGFSLGENNENHGSLRSSCNWLVFHSSLTWRIPKNFLELKQRPS